MRLARRLAPGLLALAAACHDPTSATDGTVTATREAGGVRLANASSIPVHYFIVERSTAALIDWVACTGRACPSVPAGGSVVIPERQIAGYQAGAREAIVYWWPPTYGLGGADSLHQFITPL